MSDHCLPPLPLFCVPAGEAERHVEELDVQMELCMASIEDLRLKLPTHQGGSKPKPSATTTGSGLLGTFHMP